MASLLAIVGSIAFILVVFVLPVWEFYRVRGLEQDSNAAPTSGSARLKLIGIVVAIVAVSLGYKLIVLGHLEQTSALFIGLPGVLATLVVVLAKPKTVTGMLCMVTAIALLISGIFLGEGFICIVMAAPIFFGVAIVIGAAVEYARRKKKSETAMTCLVALALAPMSMEGVLPRLSFPRDQSVVAERLVVGSSREIESQLSKTPQFSATLPAFLRLGFPQPIAVQGSGLAPGSQRIIRFGGGEGKPGDLRLTVTESTPGRVVFRADSDTSHIAHWMIWQTAEVDWQEVSTNRTRVRWTLRYRRSLDPAWYFAPWERYAVRLAGNYLIENVTTPQSH